MLLDECLQGRELPALDSANQVPLKVVRKDDVGEIDSRHRFAPYFTRSTRPS